MTPISSSRRTERRSGSCVGSGERRSSRPTRTPIGLKFAAICFVLVAVGLFVIPHDVAPRELFSEAFDPSAEKHNQTLYGLLIILAGLVGGAIGIVLGTSKQQDVPDN